MRMTNRFPGTHLEPIVDVTPQTIDQFDASSSRTPVFCLSLAAGGAGD